MAGLSAAAFAIPGCAHTGRKTARKDPDRKPPNFVFILSDDQGWSGTSVMMDPDYPDSASDYIKTPNLDRLAAGGIRFSNGYCPAAMCSPTRYSIQFGKTPARLLKTDNYGPDEESRKRIDASTPIPRILKESGLGYVTAHLGKWHMTPGPEEFGYDVHDGPTGNGNGNVLEPGNPREGIKAIPLPPDDPKRIFSLTKRSNAFMEQQTKSGNPFYLQVSHYAVHEKVMALAQTAEDYENKPRGKWQHESMFAACTKDLDTGIGILLDKIEELGIADNTYIFYMADNGAESVRWGRELRNMPLRRGKFTFFEGGIRVPMLAVGPGIKPGSHCKTPVWGCDFLPTIHDLAGIRKPLPNDLDGGSLVPILAGDDQGKVYRRNIDGLVFHCTEGSAWSGTRRQTAIRLGTWKLIKNYYNDGEILLFDLDKDPYEWNNLAEKMPAKRDELLGKMSAYLRRVKAKDATMTPEEIYEMQHAEECVAAKKKGWVGYSKPGAPAEYPIPSFSDEERFPDPYSNAVTPEKDK